MTSRQSREYIIATAGSHVSHYHTKTRRATTYHHTTTHRRGVAQWRRRWLGLGAWLHAGRPGCSRRGGLPMVLRKEAERCTRCRRRGWRRSSEALRRRCRRPALCGPLAGILLLVTARHGDPRRRVPPRRRRDPQLRRHFRFGWAGTQDAASQAWNLQLRSPETGTHAYGTYWRGPTLTVRGPTVAIPPALVSYGARAAWAPLA